MQEWAKASPFQNPIVVISFGILLALYPEKKKIKMKLQNGKSTKTSAK